jgi:4-oxalocrotonate tautomerase
MEWPVGPTRSLQGPSSRKSSKNARAREENVMPHVIVKLYSGKSERQKQALAQAVTEAVTRTLNYGEESVSVGIEDVEPKDWNEKVYKPDVIDKPDTIYKKPGYDPR